MPRRFEIDEVWRLEIQEVGLASSVVWRLQIHELELARCRKEY